MILGGVDRTVLCRSFRHCRQMLPGEPCIHAGAIAVAFSLCLFLLPGCHFPAAPEEDSLVSSLRFSPSAFDSFRRNTEMKFSLKTATTVSITIVRDDSVRGRVLVKTLVEHLRHTKGSHAVTWLGDTEQRLFAPSGTYVGVLVAGDRQFETTVQVFHF